jgi:hypothetical protein
MGCIGAVTGSGAGVGGGCGTADAAGPAAAAAALCAGSAVANAAPQFLQKLWSGRDSVPQIGQDMAILHSRKERIRKASLRNITSTFVRENHFNRSGV